MHFEIPADDTAKARQFWGSLFDWQFEATPGPFEYHMARISDQVGVAVTNMEPGKRGIRTYFYVDDINAAERGAGTYLYGRTMREMMIGWEPIRPWRAVFHWQQS